MSTSEGTTMLIRANRALVRGKLADDIWIAIQDGWIREVGTGRPPGRPDTDVDGILSPGLVDLQVNGAFGHDWSISSTEAWLRVAGELPSTGVTAFVPTIITGPLTDMLSALERYARAASSLRSPAGARILGMHAEGPFLAHARRGAHPADALLGPTRETGLALLRAGDGHLRMITLAPELEGALDLTRTLVDQGVRVSIGHTDATSAQATAAVETGATMVTHLYNAMGPLHHREPGPIGVALTDPRLSLGLIVDGYHVSTLAVRLAFAAAGPRIYLVTDATAAAGMPPGEFELGGEPIVVRADAPPTRRDGALAGSSLTMDRAVANTIAAGVDPEAALTAATTVPANAIGRRDLGRLAPGTRADMTAFDTDWRITSTWVAGRAVHDGSVTT